MTASNSQLAASVLNTYAPAAMQRPSQYLIKVSEAWFKRHIESDNKPSQGCVDNTQGLYMHCIFFTVQCCLVIWICCNCTHFFVVAQSPFLLDIQDKIGLSSNALWLCTHSTKSLKKILTEWLTVGTNTINKNVEIPFHCFEQHRKKYLIQHFLGTLTTNKNEKKFPEIEVISSKCYIPFQTYLQCSFLFICCILVRELFLFSHLQIFDRFNLFCNQFLFYFIYFCLSLLYLMTTKYKIYGILIKDINLIVWKQIQASLIK